MSIAISGATRLNVIVGDPIAQVKSPGGMTAAFEARRHDGILVPVHVSPADLGDFLRIADRLHNLDGIIVTVPHKFDCYAHCSSATERANFLNAVNIMRRRKDGGWHGEMVDGMGCVGAIRQHGCVLEGSRALLIGAGGAGSAIGLELLENGIKELLVHDADILRRDGLIDRLARRGKGKIGPGSTDPSGIDIVVNATPMGMRPSDPLPIDTSKLTPNIFVGCVITAPAVSPLVEAARRIGCRTSTGTDMYRALQSAMVDFLMAGERIG